MRFQALTIALLLSATGANAESSNLTKAVNFVIYNNEDANKLQPVDEANCVFGPPGSALKMFFNNIYVDQVSLTTKSEPHNTGSSRRPEWKVFNFVNGTLKGKGFQNSELGNNNELTWFLGMTDQVDIDRHKRAWAYIYGAGGCKSLKRSTPF